MPDRGDRIAHRRSARQLVAVRFMMARFYQGVGVVTLSARVCMHIDLTLTGVKGPLNKSCAKVW